MPSLRLGHGVHIPAGLDAADAFAAGLDAWAAVLPASAVFSSLTAARAHGLWLPPLPERTPWFVVMGRENGESVPVRPELHVTRPVRTTASEDGRLTTVPETLLACARDCALLDVVVLVDSALHLGLTDVQTVLATAKPRAKGSSRLREAVALSDARSESPWETLLRVLHTTAGIDTVPQQDLFDADGRFVGRADLLVVGTRTLHEYDGPDHRTLAGQRRDLGRDRRLLGAGYVRRGFTAQDVIRHPHNIIREACESLGTPFTMEQIFPWLALVEQSLFSASGQRQALNRWLRSEVVGKNAKALRALG